MDQDGPEILLYGSMMNKENIKEYFGAKYLDKSRIVTVDGYKRVFNTGASVRDANSNNRAILNAEKNDKFEMNAVMIPKVGFDKFGKYAFREDGYRFEMVGSNIREIEEPQTKIIMATDRKVADNEIHPHINYLEKCLKSAESWGDKFYSKFVETTYLMNGQSLEQYLKS